MNPDAFCPGKQVFAIVTFLNQGCADSVPCMTEVTLEDGNNFAPLVLKSQKHPLPALAPGDDDVFPVTFATPASAAGTSGILGVRARADINRDNPDQCDRKSLDASIAKPFFSAPPLLSLTVGVTGVIRPGEIPALSWSIRNACSEIGTAEVEIHFDKINILPTTKRAIPLQSTVFQNLKPTDILTMAIPQTFWTIGIHSVDLVITGNGMDPGPYRISVPISVIPEPIDQTWWTWDPPPAAEWKSSYTVTAKFSNRGMSPMTIKTLTATEHPTDVMGTGEDATAAPRSSVFTATPAPGGSVTARFDRFQNWKWLEKGTTLEVGPAVRIFSYVANFSLEDGFLNLYTIVSGPTLVTVSVASTKYGALDQAELGIFIGISFLALAAVAGNTLVYPANVFVRGPCH